MLVFVTSRRRFSGPGGRPGPGLTGFWRTGRAGDGRGYSETGGGRGAGEPLPRGWVFPRLGAGVGEWPGQPEPGVDRDDQPGPPVPRRRGRGSWRWSSRGLLNEATGALEVQAAQERLSQPVHLAWRSAGARGPPPGRLGGHGRRAGATCSRMRVPSRRAGHRRVQPGGAAGQRGGPGPSGGYGRPGAGGQCADGGRQGQPCRGRPGPVARRACGPAVALRHSRRDVLPDQLLGESRIYRALVAFT